MSQKPLVKTEERKDKSIEFKLISKEFSGIRNDSYFETTDSFLKNGGVIQICIPRKKSK